MQPKVLGECRCGSCKQTNVANYSEGNVTKQWSNSSARDRKTLTNDLIKTVRRHGVTNYL